MGSAVILRAQQMAGFVVLGKGQVLSLLQPCPILMDEALCCPHDAPRTWEASRWQREGTEDVATHSWAVRGTRLLRTVSLEV